MWEMKVGRAGGATVVVAPNICSPAGVSSFLSKAQHLEEEEEGGGEQRAASRKACKLAHARIKKLEQLPLCIHRPLSSSSSSCAVLTGLRGGSGCCLPS